MESRTFPAKVLLFGEYAIIRGASALAVPFHDFGGRWAFSENEGESQELSGLAAYLEGLRGSGELLTSMHIGRFRDDIRKGLYFNSTIPVGYGLGSSGALVAAVYDSYGPNRKRESRPEKLKPVLAQIESFFHGSSSGIDPLVCLLDRPLLLKDSRHTELVELPKGIASGRGGIFLLDTGISRETGPLVRIFLSKCEDLAFDELVEDKLGGMGNAAIRAFLSDNWNGLQFLFAEISRFQWDHFQEMIPVAFRAIWSKGLNSPHFRLKLCGAGGGGFLLGMAPDLETAKKELAPHRIIPVHRWD